MNFSIIIPIYNSEKWVQQCLDSIFSQRVEMAFEVICVNDGSTDGSKVILEKYKKKHSNLIVIEKENAGVAAARNSGINVAKGDYILFIDNDDLLTNDAFEVLSKEIEDSPDSVVFRYEEFNSNTGELIRTSPIMNDTRKNCITGEAAYLNNDIPSVPWNRIYKRSFLNNNNLIFELPLPEDLDFDFRVFAYAKKVKIINNVIYRFRNNPTTQSRSLKSSIKYINGILELIPKHLFDSKNQGSYKYWNKTFLHDIIDLNIHLAKYKSQKNEIKEYVIKERGLLNNIILSRFTNDKYYFGLLFFRLFYRIIPVIFILILQRKGRL